MKAKFIEPPAAYEMRNYLETAEQIKAAVREGRKVYCDSHGYTVENPVGEQWLICFAHSDYCIGLTHKDGKTLNGKSFWTE